MSILAISTMLALIMVQSILGAGILIFGVPILTIYEFQYLSIVGLLLPSSLTISILQVFKFKHVKLSELRHVPIAIIGIILGLILLLQTNKSHLLPTIIGCIMLLAAIVRLHSGIKRKVERAFRQYRSIFHLLNAIIHGFTNLGGVLLTVYSSTVHAGKISSVYCTALFYFIYATSQIIVITTLGKAEVFYDGLFYVPVTAIAYITLGKKSLEIVSQRQFDIIVTIFFIFAGLTILLRNHII